PTNGVFNYTHYTNNASGTSIAYTVSVSGATMYTNRLALMDRYTNTMETLRALSEKELSKTVFSTNDTQFIQHLVEFDYVGRRTYTGWYPNLFYHPGSEYVPWTPDFNQDSGDEKGSDFWDPLVTTVHTDSSDAIVGDPGSILHEAVGNVQFML